MSAQDQVLFLLTCIEHCQSGMKIDFDAVAKSLRLPSKAAAAKRFMRLKKKSFAKADLNIDAVGDRDGSRASTFLSSGQASEASSVPMSPASSKRKRTAATTLKEQDGKHLDDAGMKAEADSDWGYDTKFSACNRSKRAKTPAPSSCVVTKAEAYAVEVGADLNASGLGDFDAGEHDAV